MNKILILDNIRSVINIGAIFRTADAIGIDKIYLVGYTPAPIDRFGRERSDFKKAALGAEKFIEWESVKDLTKLIKKLKDEGFEIIALEQSENSTDYKKVKPNEKAAIILGNETEGISSEILNKCDQIAEIPMRGEKESLNVSVSAGIFLYRLFDL
jgi:23S rRNA (guanosine2251-2'-O)-methyltransferase